MVSMPARNSALSSCLHCVGPSRGRYHSVMPSSVGCVWELLREDALFITYCDDAATPEQWHEDVKVMRGFKGRFSIHFLVYAEAVPPREVLAEIAGVARGEPWTVALI